MIRNSEVHAVRLRESLLKSRHSFSTRWSRGGRRGWSLGFKEWKVWKLNWNQNSCHGSQPPSPLKCRLSQKESPHYITQYTRVSMLEFKITHLNSCYSRKREITLNKPISHKMDLKRATSWNNYWHQFISKNFASAKPPQMTLVAQKNFWRGK